MSYFDKNPRHFRLFFGALLLYALVMASIGSYRFGSAPNDENWFANPPSTLYYLDPIPATSVDAGDEHLLEDGFLPPNNLIISADGEDVGTPEQLRNIAERAQKDSLLLEVHHLKTNTRFLTTVGTASLEDLRARELPATAYVMVVVSDGASDRAGMKAGDLIYTINGKRFDTINEADVILQQGQIGKTLRYEVIRDNEIVSLDVTLANFGFPFAKIILDLSGLVFLVVAGVIGLRRPQIRGARSLALLLTAFGFLLIMLISIQRGLTGTMAWLAPLSVAISAFGIFPLYLQTCLVFPKEHPGAEKKRWLVPVAYGIAIASLVAANWLGQVAFNIGFLASILYLLIAPTLIRKYRTEEYKTLSRPIKYAGIAALVLTVAAGFVFFQSGTGIGLYVGFIGVPLLLIPAGYLYVIGRYRLLDLNLRIRRSLQYHLAASAWVILIGTLFIWSFIGMVSWDPEIPSFRLTGASLEFVDQPMTPEERGTAQTVVIVLIVLLVAAVLWRIGRRGLDFIAAKFHRTRYDYRRAANELTEVMSTRFGMTELSRGITEKLAELMKLKRVGILFFDSQKKCCSECAHGFDGRYWSEFCVTRQRKLVDAIKQFQGEFRVDYLPQEMKEEFSRNEFQYLIPIRSKDRLVGTIFVGEKQSEATFLQEDLEFLRAVARQASVAIENAFLYEELTEQERLKHELAIARRIQLESLPQETPQIEGLDIAGTSVPAMEVGGDYYDFLNGAANRFTVVVGDVSGKGTSAALYMAKIQGILRSLSSFGLSPRELFSRTNKLLWNDIEKKSFVTAFGASFAVDENKVTIARAGHLPLYFYQAKDQSIQRVIPRGIGLGLSGNGSFDDQLEEQVLPFSSGDIFLFVTDGITEGTDQNGNQFGEEGLLKVLEKGAGESAASILTQLTSAVAGFSDGANQHDDQTAVVVRIR